MATNPQEKGRDELVHMLWREWWFHCGNFDCTVCLLQSFCILCVCCFWGLRMSLEDGIYRCRWNRVGYLEDPRVSWEAFAFTLTWTQSSIWLIPTSWPGTSLGRLMSGIFLSRGHTQRMWRFAWIWNGVRCPWSPMHIWQMICQRHGFLLTFLLWLKAPQGLSEKWISSVLFVSDILGWTDCWTLGVGSLYFVDVICAVCLKTRCLLGALCSWRKFRPHLVSKGCWYWKLTWFSRHWADPFLALFGHTKAPWRLASREWRWRMEILPYVMACDKRESAEAIANVANAIQAKPSYMSLT